MDVIPLRPTAIGGLSPAATSSQDKLAEGRIFAAQVMQLLDGGSVILGVGRERIAATSQAALQAGQRLFLKVRGSGAAQAFEIVGSALPEDASGVGLEALDANHPFRWLAKGQGVGELLGELARALVARGAASPAAAQELARALEQFALAPGATGAELARHLSSSGLSHEARLLARAIEGLPNPVLASAAQELVALAFAALEVEGEVESARRALAGELARLLTDPVQLARLQGTACSEAERAGLAAKALAEWIGPALERGLDPKLDAGLRARIVEALAVARLSPRLARAVIEVLLGERAALARALEEPAAAQGVPRAPDLKQWLSTAMARLEPGPEQAAVRAAFDALEAEQFIALARASQGDGSSWVFALRDGLGFSDARLVHRRTGEREAKEDGTREPRIERAVLGLEFSRTGPVRADLALDGNTLHVRLNVSREEVAARMNAAQGELLARLQAAGRSVQLSIGVCSPEDLRVPGVESDAQLGAGRAALDRFG